MAIYIDEIKIKWKEDLQEVVEESSGQRISFCYQCGKCSGGCPLTEFMDYTPRQINRLLQLGEEEEVLSCCTIWLCLTCSTCTVRCPQKIDLARIMESLRILAVQYRKVGVKDIFISNQLLLKQLKMYGRLNRMRLLGIRKSKNLINTAKIGKAAIQKKKIKPFKILTQEKVKDQDCIKAIFEQYGGEDL